MDWERFLACDGGVFPLHKFGRKQSRSHRDTVETLFGQNQPLADEATQRNTLNVIEEALAPYADSRGVYLGYSTWIVSATRP